MYQKGGIRNRANKKDDYYKGIGWILIHIALVASGPCFYKITIASGLGLLTTISYFLLIGGIAMLLLYNIQNRNRGNNQHSSEMTIFIKRLSKLTVLVRFIFLSISWPMFYCCFVLAMEMKSVTETSVIVRLGPLILTLLIIKLMKNGAKIKNTPLLIISFLLCIAGIIVLQGFNKDKFMNFFSFFIFLGIFAALMFAITKFLIEYCEKKDKLDKTVLISSSMLLGSIMLMPFCLIFDRNPLTMPTIDQSVYLFLIGFVTGFGHSCYANACKKVDSSRLSLFLFFNPVFTGIYAHILKIDKELDYPSLVLAFILITLGLIFKEWSVEKQKNNKTKGVIAK